MLKKTRIITLLIKGEPLATLKGLSATKSRVTSLAVNLEVHYVSEKLLLTGHEAGCACVWRFAVNEERLEPGQTNTLPMLLRLEAEVAVGGSGIVSTLSNIDVKGFVFGFFGVFDAFCVFDEFLLFLFIYF